MLNKSTFRVALALAGAAAGVVAQASVDFVIPDGSGFNGALLVGGVLNPANSSFSATASSAFTVGNIVSVSAATLTPVITTTWGEEAQVAVYNTAAPTVFGSFQLSTLQGTYTSISVPAGNLNLGGGLVGQTVTSGATLVAVLYDTFDDGTGADATVTGLTLNVSSASASFPFSATVAGPVPSVDFPFDPDNAVISLGSVSSAFTLGTSAVFSGTFTRLVTGEFASDTIIRLRNSAVPTAHADFRPFTSGSVATDFVAGANRPFTGALVGQNLPSGSTISAEFWNSFEDATSGVAESELSAMTIALVAGPADTPPPPPAATDLGTISNTSAVYETPDLQVPFTVAPEGVQWYKFTVANTVSDAAGLWLDIDTTPTVPGTGGDTEIAIYDSLGQFRITNDDGGVDFFSLVSFGQTSPARGPIVSGSLSSALPAAGQSGLLVPGTYYIAVTGWNVAVLDEFVIDSAGASGGSGFLNFRTNLPAPIQVLSGTLALGAVSGTPSFTRAMSAQLLDGSGNPVGSAVTINASTPTAFSVSVPSSLTGSYSLLIDGSTFLKRRVALTLTGSNQSLGTVVATNGDVNEDGIVDGNDVNAILADFGNEGDGLAADVNMDSIVDGNDINVVLGTFGSEDE